jgi:hypothetical protein
MIYKLKSIALGVVIAVAMACVATSASAYQVYYEDFQDNSAGSVWSSQLIDTAPNPDINPWWGTFLGQFSGNDAVTLTLSDIAPGLLTLSFDTYFIRSWDGDATTYGKDYFDVSVGDTILLHDTFSNGNPAGQSYVGNGIKAPAYANVANSSMTGSSLQYALGYWFNDGIHDTNEAMDSIYNFSFSFYNSLPELSFTFKGIGLQGNTVNGLSGESYYDESWGLDNVRVDVVPVPEPAAFLLVSSGIIGLFALQRRSNKKKL